MHRLGYLHSPGGLTAAVVWLFTKLCRVQCYAFLSLHSNSEAAANKIETGRFRYLTIASIGDIETARETWLCQLNSRAGAPLEELVESDGSVHALVDGDIVVCQLTIRRVGAVAVDTPVPMKIQYAEADCFIQYLVTSPEYRRQGAAMLLLAAVAHDSSAGANQRLLAHVRMTNVPSLNTFRKAGWRRLGWIVTSRRGRLLWERGLTASGIRIEVEQQPPCPHRGAEVQKVID